MLYPLKGPVQRNIVSKYEANPFSIDEVMNLWAMLVLGRNDGQFKNYMPPFGGITKHYISIVWTEKRAMALCHKPDNHLPLQYSLLPFNINSIDSYWDMKNFNIFLNISNADMSIIALLIQWIVELKMVVDVMWLVYLEHKTVVETINCLLMRDLNFMAFHFHIYRTAKLGYASQRSSILT